MTWILIAMLLTTIAVLAFRSKDLVTAAYYDGYRAGIKDSVAEIKKVSNEEFDRYLPYGKIMEALSRTSIIGTAVDRVKLLAQRIGRAL